VDTNHRGGVLPAHPISDIAADLGAQLRRQLAPRIRLPTLQFLNERTKARIISFVQRFVAASESDSTLPSPLSFYGPSVRFNGRPVSHEFIQQQFDVSRRTFPQRSFQFISGPLVSPSPDSSGAMVNYELSGVLSNGLQGFHVRAAVQLTIQRRGDSFEIAVIQPRILERQPL
jgi:hypothetical protein